MMVYWTLLFIGFFGLVAQMLLGFGHGPAGHVGHTGHAGRLGDSGQGSQAGHAGHAAAGHHSGDAHQSHSGHSHSNNDAVKTLLWSILSPLAIFSTCLGAGAAGLLGHLAAHLSAEMIALIAVLGGIGFYGLIVRPLWTTLLRFGSEPSQALNGVTAREVEADTRFDKSGKGLIRLTVDGQIVRVLATLEDDERTTGGTILPGDKLTVTSVDGRTNTCRVARM